MSGLVFGQTNITWTGANGANGVDWNRAQNWTGGLPDTIGEVALFSTATASDPAAFGTAITIGGFNLTGGETRALSFTNTIALDQYGVDNSSAFNFSISGAGTTTLTAAQTWSITNSGNTTFSKAIANGGLLLTLEATNTGVGLIDSIISGTGGIAKTGSGTWTLSGVNTYTGTTTLSAGNLRATTSAQALGTGISALSLAGGTLELANNTGLNFGRNTTVTGNTTILSDRLTAGAGVTHTLGTLSIGAQTLTVGTDPLTVTSGTAGLTFGATTLSATGATFAVNANSLLTLGAVSGNTFGFTVTGAGNTTIGGAIGTTTGTLTKSGAGTLTLNAANSFTGLTTVSGGTLAYGISNALSTGAVTISGGTLALGANSDAVGAVTLTSGSITSTSGVLTGSSYALESGSISAILAGTGAVNKTTAGTVTLSGANTFTGITTISNGILSVETINNGSVAGNLGQASNAATNLVLSGGTLQYTGATASTDRSFTLNAATTGTIDVSTSATTLTMSGSSAATTGALNKAGTGTLALTGSNNHTGITTISAGTLQIGAGGTTGSLSSSSSITNNSELSFNRSNTMTQGTDFGTISGTGTVTQAGREPLSSTPRIPTPELPRFLKEQFVYKTRMR